MKASLDRNHFHFKMDAPYGNSYYGNEFYVNAYLKVGEPFEAIFCRSNSFLEPVFIPGTDRTDNPVKNPNFFNERIGSETIQACETMTEALGRVAAAFYNFVQKKLADNDCPPRKKFQLVEVAE